MSGVAEAISNAVSDVGETIGDVGGKVVDAVGGAVQTIGSTLKSVGDAALNDPIGTIAKVAAVATGQLYLLPVISATDVIAHGGNLEQAALSAGLSYAGMGIASGVSDMLAAGSESTLIGSSIDQVDGSTIYTYSDGSTMASMPDGTTSFTNPTNITGALNTGISNAAANAAITLAKTKDIGAALTSGVTSGAGTYVGSSVTEGLTDNVVTTGAKLAGTVAGGLTVGALTGKDPTANIVNNIISTSLSAGGSQLKSLWNNVTAATSQYNQQQTAAQDLLNNTVVPSQKDAQAAQDTAKASYDSYTTVNNQFTDLNNKYKEAVASGDTTLANSLADQANALIPQLNAATDKYNADASTFQAKLDTFNTNNAKLTDTSTQLAALKSTYATQTTAFTDASKELTDAAAKVVGMSTDAQQAFTSNYVNGASVTDALGTAKTVNEMAVPAQEAFTRNYNTSKDLTSSLDIANQVNSLDTNSQNAYSTAVKNGLNDTQALNLARQMAGMNTAGQTEYVNAIQKGLDPQSATLSATLTDLFGQQNTTPTTTPVDKTSIASTNTTGTVTDAGAGPATPIVKIPESSTGNAASDGSSVTIEPFDPNSPDPAITGENDPAYQEYLFSINGGTNPDGSIRPSLDVVPVDYTQWKQNEGSTGTAVGNTAGSSTGAIGDTTGSAVGNTAGSSTGAIGDTTGTAVGNTAGSSAGDISSAPTTSSFDLGALFNSLTGGSKTAATVPGTTSAPVKATTSVPITRATTPSSGIMNLNSGSLNTSGTNNGITNLTPGLTQSSDYTLSGIPNIQESINPMQPVPQFATGGSSTTDPYTSSGISNSLTPGLTKAQINYILAGLPGSNISIPGHADGGEIQEDDHNATFFSPGGLANTYVQGDGDGTSDSVKAMLANGEFVIPADVVSDLGNGSNEAGASVLDQFLKSIREHKQANGVELPPDSKGPLEYLSDATRKVKV